MFEALNHAKPATPIKTNSSTKHGFVQNDIHQKRSKSWDTRHHWLRERNVKKEFNVFWDKGTNNNADYFTKHHPTQHHLHARQSRYYVRDA